MPPEDSRKLRFPGDAARKAYLLGVEEETTMIQIYGTRSDTTELITLGQLQIRYLRDGAEQAQTGAFEMLVPSASNVPPPHSHAHNEEYLYVLEGRLRYSVEGEVRDLGAGESAYTPRGAVHGFSNPFLSSARVLIVQSPDIGAQYFRDVAAVLGAGGPPDRAKLMQVMARYGLKVGAAVSKKSVLVVGLDPALIDFSKPGYAPGMTTAKVLAGIKFSEEELARLGYQATTCLTDFGDTAEAVVQAELQRERFDGVLIGAGVRANPDNFRLFERLVNVVHRHAPQAKICFNQQPHDIAEAVKRWV
jgi:quercetin dioxygenase-like cupin family protein